MNLRHPPYIDLTGHLSSLKSSLTPRRRYWDSLQSFRHEAAFPSRQISAPVRRVRRVRNVRPVRLPRPSAITIAQARFQRKRRQIVKTYLRRVL